MLIKPNELPPGGFSYIQTDTGMRFDGMRSFKEVCIEIKKHRLANNLKRASMTEIAEDLDKYTCGRLGNDPRWCSTGTTTAYVPVVRTIGCGGCGSRR